MDYSNWTDFAINAAVGAATGEARNSEPLLKLVIRNSTGRKFDPCNNPADAWPIIFSNRIALTPYGHGAAFWEAEDRYGTGKSDCDKNPLRAAMIVFLKMQESE